MKRALDDAFRFKVLQNFAELWFFQNGFSVETYIDICGYYQLSLFNVSLKQSKVNKVKVKQDFRVLFYINSSDLRPTPVSPGQFAYNLLRKSIFSGRSSDNLNYILQFSLFSDKNL